MELKKALTDIRLYCHEMADTSEIYDSMLKDMIDYTLINLNRGLPDTDALKNAKMSVCHNYVKGLYD